MRIVDEQEAAAHNTNVTEAWREGHKIAPLDFFTLEPGEKLMAKLESLPAGTPVEEYHRLVREHVGAPEPAGAKAEE